MSKYERHHWPGLLKCGWSDCSPNPACDDYINGRIIKNPDYFVECTKPYCSARTPDLSSFESACNAWNAMMETLNNDK